MADDRRIVVSRSQAICIIIKTQNEDAENLYTMASVPMKHIFVLRAPYSTDEGMAARRAAGQKEHFASIARLVEAGVVSMSAIHFYF